MSFQIWDDIIEEVNHRIPNLNEYLIKHYRKEQIDNCINYIKMTFIEAAKLFEGEIKFKDYRILRPDERIHEMLDNPKYAPTIDITQTELMLVEFRFEVNKQIFSTLIYLPYLYNDAIIINGSKYYVQFALTDKVFYHISRENGLGIKVLRAHLRFWRNYRHRFQSVSGHQYSDNILIVKIHMKDRKATVDDIKTALILYPLSRFGWNSTLSRYGIVPNQIQMTTQYDDNDTEHEYFIIREGKDKNDRHLFMKVHKSVLSTNPTIEEKIKLRVVSAIHYVLQYFVRCKNTIYTNNTELADLLMNDPEHTVWQIILGRTIYGFDYKTEIQTCANTIQHLTSLKTYLDPYTKQKLDEINVHCNDIYDLIDHIFVEMDNYVINYFPADLYKKRLNVLDLLLGNIVQGIFHRVYSQTNNRKGGKVTTDAKDIIALFRMGTKAISQIHKATGVIAGNPSVYNDNYLVTVGCRKTRATFSTPNSNKKNATGQLEGSTKRKQVNLMSNSTHRYHPSQTYVESMLHINHQSPSINGTINPCVPIAPNGDIIKEPYASDIDKLAKFIITE